MDAEFLKVADDAFLFYCFKCDEWSFFDRFCNNLTEPERWFSFSTTVFSKPQSGEEKTTPRVDIEDLIMIGQRQEHWSTRPLRRDNNIWTCVISAPHFYASNLKFLKKNHQNISFFHDKNLPRSKISTAFEQRMEMEEGSMSVFCCCFFLRRISLSFLRLKKGLLSYNRSRGDLPKILLWYSNYSPVWTQFSCQSILLSFKKETRRFSLKKWEQIFARLLMMSMPIAASSMASAANASLQVTRTVY